VGAGAVAVSVSGVGGLAHAASSNRHKRVSNGIKHRFKVFMLPVYNCSDFAFARLSHDCLAFGRRASNL
jgi:hypothetical protein